MRNITKEELSIPENAHIFYKLQQHPVFMLVPLKSGCTFFKNLWYYLDHGEVNLLGDFIHDDETGLTKASLDDLDNLVESPYVFMVIRHPVRRFLSLYFDKIANPFDQSFSWFQEDVGKDLGMTFGADLSLEEHKKNARLLIGWIEQNLNKETPQGVDAHWQPQLWRHMQVRDFKPVLLPLEEIDTALPALIGDEIPDIKESMDKIKSRNVSYKPFSNDEMRHWPLTKKLREVYAGDFKMHNEAMKNWRELTGQTQDVSD